MTVADSLPGSSRRAEIATAIGIGVVILIMLAMVLHHPTARQTDPAALIDSIARQASADRLVHGTLAAAMTLMTSLISAAEEAHALPMPPLAYGAIAAAVFVALGIVMWSYRDVAKIGRAHV